MKISWGRKRQSLCNPIVRAVCVLSVVSSILLAYGKGTSGAQNTSLVHYCLVIRHPVLRMLHDGFLYLALCVDVLAHVSLAHLRKISNIAVGAFQDS